MNAERKDNSPNKTARGDMSGPFFKSLVLHVIIFVVTLVGIPFIKKDPIIINPVSVELVDVSDLEKAKSKPPPKTEPIEKPKEPEPPKEPPKPKPPEPEPEPPKPEPVPTPEPKEEELKEPEPPKEPPKPEPKKEEEKPKEPERDISDLLKDLTPPDDAPAPEPDNEPVEDAGPIPDYNVQMSMSELDSLNAGIGACWRIDGGLRNAEDLQPKLRVYVDDNMVVQRIVFLEQLRYDTDPAYRAMANSADRALRNPRCNKLNLPLEKYRGKYFDFTFDPRDMLGY